MQLLREAVDAYSILTEQVNNMETSDSLLELHDSG